MIAFSTDGRHGPSGPSALSAESSPRLLGDLVVLLAVRGLLALLAPPWRPASARRDPGCRRSARRPVSPRARRAAAACRASAERRAARRAASLGSPDFVLRPGRIGEADGVEDAAVELHVIHGAAGRTEREAQRQRAARLPWQDGLSATLLSPVHSPWPPVGPRQAPIGAAPTPNRLGYNGFAASLQLARTESYSSPATPATMATSAMLNTYQ